MTPSEKYGAEFIFDRLSIPTRESKIISCHQAGVAISPKDDKESTLDYAWQVVRELAEWLDTFNGLPKEERFQIIVGWSKTVRPQQGQIFKIWGFKERMQKITSCETYQEFVRQSGHTMVPMPNWEKDVFQKRSA